MMNHTEENNDGIEWLIVVWILFIALVAYTGTMPDNIVAGAILSLR